MSDKVIIKHAKVWWDGAAYCVRFSSFPHVGDEFAEVMRQCRNAWGPGRLDLHREGFIWIPDDEIDEESMVN